jgi:hypothetical protein
MIAFALPALKCVWAQLKAGDARPPNSGCCYPVQTSLLLLCSVDVAASLATDTEGSFMTDRLIDMATAAAQRVQQHHQRQQQQLPAAAGASAEQQVRVVFNSVYHPSMSCCSFANIVLPWLQSTPIARWEE